MASTSKLGVGYDNQVSCDEVSSRSSTSAVEGEKKEKVDEGEREDKVVNGQREEKAVVHLPPIANNSRNLSNSASSMPPRPKSSRALEMMNEARRAGDLNSSGQLRQRSDDPFATSSSAVYPMLNTLDEQITMHSTGRAVETSTADSPAHPPPLRSRLLARRGTVVMIPDAPPAMPLRTTVEVHIANVSTAIFTILGVLSYVATVYVVWLDATEEKGAQRG